jgi:hypothetical protein
MDPIPSPPPRWRGARRRSPLGLPCPASRLRRPPDPSGGRPLTRSVIGGPGLTLPGPRLLSPLRTGHLISVRAGLSRRQVGGRGDLCAGLSSSAGPRVPLLRLGEQHLEEFLRVYPARSAKAHGPLRPVVERVRRGFMRCGLVEHGFARLWCGTCRASVLCPFSCRGRSFCPSCEKKKRRDLGEAHPRRPGPEPGGGEAATDPRGDPGARGRRRAGGPGHLTTAKEQPRQPPSILTLAPPGA